jgi:hypothetical protein
MQFKRHFQDVGIGEISSAPILLTTFYSQIWETWTIILYPIINKGTEDF